MVLIELLQIVVYLQMLSCELYFPQIQGLPCV